MNSKKSNNSTMITGLKQSGSRTWRMLKKIKQKNGRKIIGIFLMHKWRKSEILMYFMVRWQVMRRRWISEICMILSIINMRIWKPWSQAYQTIRQLEQSQWREDRWMLRNIRRSNRGWLNNSWSQEIWDWAYETMEILDPISPYSKWNQ